MRRKLRAVQQPDQQIPWKALPTTRTVIYGKRVFAVPLNRVFTCAVFALWVSICAATPEIIWEGLIALTGHFSKIQVYSVIFIAMLLAFFVEPIMERIKNGSWELEQPVARVDWLVLRAGWRRRLAPLLIPGSRPCGSS